MAGSITVSSITLDSDNNFSIKSNTGATLFFANTTGIDIANSIGATAITNDKILSVANTKISGNIISSQITSVANTQLTGNITSSQIAPSVTLTTPIISGNLNLDSAGTTGIRVPSANTIVFHTAGTEDVRIDANGNMGISVTPSSWDSTFKVLEGPNGDSIAYLVSGASLQMASNAYYNGGWKYKSTGIFARYILDSTGTQPFVWFTAASGSADGAVSQTQAMTLDSSGNLLVGATSGSTHIIQKSAASSTVLQIINSGASSTNGATFNFSAAAPNNGTQTFFATSDTGGYRGGWLSNGGIQNYQGNNSNLSDRREKTNFAPAKSYLDVVCAIPVQTFNYIDQNMEEDGGLTLGVVAQDVQAVAPEMVIESNWGTEGDPKMRLAIYQTDLQYALMKSIQELKALNDTQAATITALTARIVALET